MTVDLAFPAGRWDFVPAAEIESRTRRFQAALAQAGVQLALIVLNADLFYLTGTIQQGALLVPAEGEPVLLVRKDPDRARVESPVKDIRPLGSLREMPAGHRRVRSGRGRGRGDGVGRRPGERLPAL